MTDELLLLAHRTAYEFHKGQKYGPHSYYSYHLLGVMRAAAFYRPADLEADKVAAVALLHDVIEDTACTRETLVDLGLPDDVIEAVELLTRDGDLVKANYSKGFTYIEAIAMNPLARCVKICDAQFNLSNSTYEGNDKRINKYATILKDLTRV